MNPIRLLLVDDHRLFRSGLRQLLSLSPEFLVVGEAATGEEALGMVAALTPDLVLLDIDMPGVGGVAVARTLRERHPACAILFLTGYQRYVVDGLRAGATGYVLKDADEAILVEAIHAVARGAIYLQPDLQQAVVAQVRHPTGVPVALSERERAILQLIAAGHANRAIGARLGLSEPRIKQQVSVLLEKLGAQDRAHAVAIALRTGLLPLAPEP